MGLQKLARLLRPGGMIVLTEAIESSFYVVGSEKISRLSLESSEVVRESLLQAGFADVSIKNLVPLATEMTDCTEYVFCTAVLPTL